ncbi:MAG: formate dehydrogenase subunit delta [Exilibacterium sp.]
MISADVDRELSHLIRMANQITSNIGVAGSEDERAVKVADHLLKFWAKPMREKIIKYASEGGAELDPVAYKAICSLA